MSLLPSISEAIWALGLFFLFLNFLSWQLYEFLTLDFGWKGSFESAQLFFYWRVFFFTLSTTLRPYRSATWSLGHASIWDLREQKSVVFERATLGISQDKVWWSLQRGIFLPEDLCHDLRCPSLLVVVIEINSFSSCLLNETWWLAVKVDQYSCGVTYSLFWFGLAEGQTSE